MSGNEGQNLSGAVTVAVLTFPSSHHALRAEEILKESGIPVVLIPMPTEIRSDCGVALVVPCHCQEKAEERLRREEEPPTASCRLTRTGRQARLLLRILGQEK